MNFFSSFCDKEVKTCFIISVFNKFFPLHLVKNTKKLDSSPCVLYLKFSFSIWEKDEKNTYFIILFFPSKFSAPISKTAVHVSLLLSSACFCVLKWSRLRVFVHNSYIMQLHAHRGACSRAGLAIKENSCMKQRHARCQVQCAPRKQFQEATACTMRGVTCAIRSVKQRNCMQ